MGLTNWKNSPDGLIYKYNVGIAKNYLSEEELKKLNNLTTLFLDYAEDMAEEQNIMTMQKWIDITDKLISFRDKKVLKDFGKVSHKQHLIIFYKHFTNISSKRLIFLIKVLFK